VSSPDPTKASGRYHGRGLTSSNFNTYQVRQVRIAVAGRQVLHEPVDHRGDERVLLAGGDRIAQIDLQDMLLVDHHRGRVAGADQPEHHAPVGPTSCPSSHAL
jgi:hypothetical protein